MFRKLLIPLDGSSLAEQAIGQAAAIARASSAEMDLLVVHQPFPFDGYSDAPWNTELWDWGRQYLESIVAEVTSGSSVTVTHAILRGEAIETICRRIQDVQADLVVMTSHGRTGLSRAWLGSVTDGVLRHSTVPVLVLRPIEGRTGRDAAHHLFKRVLIPLDGSALSTEVLTAATSLAKCGDARIWLLRVIQPFPLLSEAGAPYAYRSSLVDAEGARRLADEAEDQMANIARQLHDESGADVDRQVVVEPRVATAILDFARTHDIDVIAMSTHGRGMSRLLLGSVADKVLRGSGLPMLLYRPASVHAGRPLAEASAETQATSQ